MENVYGKDGSKSGDDVSQPIHKIGNSSRDIIDPLESILKNTFLFTQIAETNKLRKALVEVAKNSPGSGKFLDKVTPDFKAQSFQIKEIKSALEAAGIDTTADNIDFTQIATIFRPTQNKKGEAVIPVFTDGKVGYYQVNDIDLYNALSAMDSKAVSEFNRVIAQPLTQMLRLGSTITLEFGGRNIIRDGFMAASSKYGFIPFIDTYKGGKSVIKQSESYQQMLYAGAGGSGLIGANREVLQKQLNKMLAQKDKYNILVHPVELLTALSEFSEEATRTRIFERALKKQADTSYDSMLTAAVATREATTDFGQFGTETRKLNPTRAFFNSNIQGVDTIARRFKDDPVGATWKSLLSLTIPSLILWAANHDDKRYEELPQYEKDLFWIIPTKEKLYRVPKPFEIGMVFASGTERILNYWLLDDPKGFEGYFKQLFEVLTPSILPNYMIPPVEAIANYSFFKGQSVVPKSEQGLLPIDQYGKYTSETAKKIGKMLNASPRNVEHILKGYGGGLMQYGLDISDAVLNLTGIADTSNNPKRDVQSQIPVVKSFAVEPYQRGSATMNSMYKEIGELQSKQGSAKKNKVPFPAKEAARLKQLQAASKQISDLRKIYDIIYNDDRLTPLEKKDKLDLNNIRQINIARRVLGKSKIDD